MNQSSENANDPGDDDGVVVPELDAETRDFIDRFAEAWISMAGKRMTGRVLGLLMITDRAQLSAQEIGELLQTSDGAVSMATRALLKVGYIHRVSLPGSRKGYFRADDDVWGTFLSGERDYLHRMSRVLESGLATEAGRAPGPATRLRNGRRYMIWIERHQRNILEQWRTYRDQEDETPPETLPAEMLAEIRKDDPQREDPGDEEKP